VSSNDWKEWARELSASRISPTMAQDNGKACVSSEGVNFRIGDSQVFRFVRGRSDFLDRYSEILLGDRQEKRNPRWGVHMLYFEQLL